MERLLGTPPDLITAEEKQARLNVLAAQKHEIVDKNAANKDAGITDDTWIDRYSDVCRAEWEIEDKYPDLPPILPPEVVTLTKTCDACPTQWEGKTSDGKEVYVRYRGGYLSVRVNNEYVFSRQVHRDPEYTDEELREHYRGWSGANLESMISSYKMQYKMQGGVVSYNGVMDFDELKEHTDGWIDWKCEED